MIPFIFEAIKKLIKDDEKPKNKIGYIKEDQTKYGKHSRKNWKIKGKLWSLDVIRSELVNTVNNVPEIKKVHMRRLGDTPIKALYSGL